MERLIPFWTACRHLETHLTTGLVAAYAWVGSRERKGKGAHQERVEDPMSLVASFSRRWYGLRSHTKARTLVQAVREVVQP